MTGKVGRMFDGKFVGQMKSEYCQGVDSKVQSVNFKDTHRHWHGASVKKPQIVTLYVAWVTAICCLPS